MRNILQLLCLMLILAGCSSVNVKDYAGTQPEFRLEEYFNGKSKAWGIFRDRFGKVRNEFVVDITGTWDGDKLILDEDFVYKSGKTEKRVWTIELDGEHGYVGTAAGVVGEGRGEAYGNAFNWKYTFDLELDNGKVWRVDFDDWMYLQPDGVMVNQAKIKKWGLTLGEVTLFFQKID